MDTRAKVTHLYNRFGLGASEDEVREGCALGVEGTVHKLIEYHKTPDRFDVHPSEFVLHPRDQNVSLDPQRYTLHWILRMLTTKRPMEEKLTLFWHNHFAVSGAKVEFGPAMGDYLDVMRTDASGNFGTLLHNVSRTPAMLRWLDTEISLKNHPNENFGREIMELFTLGIGNYTEKDVKEVSRAFLGFGVRNIYNEMGRMPAPDKVRTAIENDMPLICATDCPDLRDTEPKTVLGVTKRFDAPAMCNFLASHPATTKRMMKKLWSFFAYENPEEEVVDHLAKVFVANNLEMKPVLYEMASMPQFWSSKAVGTMIKSPVDFTIGALRQFNVGPHLMSLRSEGATFRTPMDNRLLGQLYGVSRALNNQGLLPLFPPDVSGWRWGSAWVGASAMLERQKVSDMVFSNTNKGVIATPWLKTLKDVPNMKDPQVFADKVCSALGLALPTDKKKHLVDGVKSRYAKLLADGKPASQLTALKGTLRILVASPEYQLC